jgi:Rrf2 family protein
MELSCKVEYAMISLLELASQPNPNKPIQIKHVAEKHSIPERYLEQVFTLLRRAGIVQSQRGSKGGYILAKQSWQITLLDVFSSLEDPKANSRTVSPTQTDRSLVYDVWSEAQQSARDVLHRYTLKDLCQKLDDRRQINAMYYI